MKKCKLLLLALFFLTNLSAQNEALSPLIVNEVGLMPLTNEKYIELLVVGDAQNPQSPVNLQGWILDNNSDVLSQDSMFLTLGNAFSSVSPGSIILIYDQTNPHPLINVQNDGLPNSAGVYQLGFNNPALEQCVKETGFNCTAPPAFSTTTLAGVLPLAQTGDVVQLRAPDHGLQQAVSWAAVYAENGSPRTTRVSDGGGAITATISLDKTCGFQPTDYKRSLTKATPGASNSDGNAIYIQGIATGAVPATQNLSISCVAIPATATASGGIQVSISGGGLTSKIASWSGASSGWMQVPGNGTFVIPNLIPGTYNVNVFSWFTQGCAASCGAEVSLLDEISICAGAGNGCNPPCAGGCFSIGEENPNPDYTYSWEQPNAFDDPDIPFQTGICVEEDTEYQLRVFDENCSLVNTIKYDLKVHEPKEIELTVLPGDLGLCSFPVEVKATEGFQTYTWSSNPPAPNADPNIITVGSPGSFSVTATDNNGCSVISEISLSDTNIAAYAVKGMLKDKGAFAIPLINITHAFTGENDTRQLISNIYVTDHTNGDMVDIINVNNNGTQINVANELQSFLDASYFSEYDSRTSFVTNNLNICDPDDPIDIPSICSDMENLELGLWAHVWDDPDNPGAGVLYVLVKSPSQEEGFASISDFGEALVQEEYSLTQPESLASMDAEIFYIVQDQLVDFYETVWEVGDLNMKNSSDYQSILCGNIQFYVVAMNSIGFPLNIGQNASLIFKKSSKYNSDLRAAAGFTKDGDIYQAMASPASGEHTGYKSLTSGEMYPFPKFTVNQVNVILGEYEPIDPDNPERGEQIKYSRLEYNIDPNEISTFYPNNAQETLGAGDIIPNLFDSPVGAFGGPESDLSDPDWFNYPWINGVKKTPINMPNIPFDAFNHTLTIKTSSDSDSGLAQGILYEVPQSGNASNAWVYGVFEYGSLSYDMQYYIWNCDIGAWVAFDPDEYNANLRPEFKFIRALLDVARANGHLLLDLTGLVPAFGEIADFLNGTWYLAEGEYGEASLSFGSIGAPLALSRISDNLFELRKIDGTGNEVVLKRYTFDSNKTTRLEYTEAINDPVNPHNPVDLRNAEKIVGKMGESTKLPNDTYATDLFNYVKEQKGGFSAWELLARHSGPGSERLWDRDLIDKVIELRRDFPDFIETIGGDNALIEIIFANKLAGCTSCQTAGAAHLKNIHEYLDDVKYFVDNHMGVPPSDNAEQILNLARNGKRYQIDAIAQTVRYVKDGIIPNVSSFEPRLADHITDAQVLTEAQDVLKPIGNVGDVVLSTNPLRLMELKSWGLGTIDGILSNVDFIAQTKGYFLTDISNIADDLVHSFDKRKLLAAYGGPFATEADALKHIKGKYRELFTEYIDIWEAELHQLDPINGPANFQALLAKFDADSMEDFLDLVGEVGDDIFDDSIFDFIKIQ
jgi:hypothetical protein